MGKDKIYFLDSVFSTHNPKYPEVRHMDRVGKCCGRDNMWMLLQEDGRERRAVKINLEGNQGMHTAWQ